MVGRSVGALIHPAVLEPAVVADLIGPGCKIVSVGNLI